MKRNHPRVLFVDQITYRSLPYILACGRSVETIWHFEPIAPSAQRLLRIFRRLWLMRAEVRRVEHHIGHVRNDAGESDYVKLFRHARAICSNINQEQLATNALIKTMRREWAISKVLLYFKKLVEQEVLTECLRIGLVEWLLRTYLPVAPARCALLIERKQWFSYVQSHARSYGIRLLGYKRPWNPKTIVKSGARLFWQAWRALAVFLRGFGDLLHSSGKSARLNGLQDNPGIQNDSAMSTIAVRYWAWRLTFDPAQRSELFWVAGSGVPHSELLVYDYMSDKPLDEGTLNELRSRNIKILGRAPNIPAWYPTRCMYKVKLRTAIKISFGLVACWARGQWISPYYIRGLLALARDYAHWYDFFFTNRVRVNVTPTFNTSVGQVLALDALNGVSAAYQYSIILFPTTLISNGENVQFVFSPFLEERLWRSMDAPVDNFVHTGFIHDSAIQAIRGLDRVAEVRKQLEENGARFILCFFDENSMKRWDMAASDEDATRDYEYLLNWLLADPTLGIVFKPKRSTTLFQRIAGVSHLIDQASKTRRCKFLTSDSIGGNIFPAEAALIANVCVGKLVGSTAALEARLAGVPTVLIDTERFRSGTLDDWGHGQLVFDDWQSLRTAVEEYRSAPEAHPEFGDWSLILDDLDPFRDGQASLRMGLYIRWVYEALKQGANRQDALASADSQFKQKWGIAGREPAEVPQRPLEGTKLRTGIGP